MAIHTPVNCLALCAGVGGLDLAIRITVPEARAICYVEREASAAASLVASMESGRLHPAPVWSDLATFDARPWRGIVDIVTSGDPCQPNSVAGKRGGADDDRFLIDQVLRVVDECRPRRFFRENVPGNADGQLAALIPALEAMGYSVAGGIFSSAETGNSHRRERLFIMADCESERPGETRGFRRERSEERASGSGSAMDDAQCSERGRSTDHAEITGRTAMHNGQKVQVGLESQVKQWATPQAHDAAPGNGGRSEPDGRGVGLVNAQSERRGEGCSEPEFRRGWSAIAEPDGQLAEPHDARLPRGGAGCDPQRWQEPDGYAGLGGREFLTIPGPSDPRWASVLAARPDLAPAISKAEAQSLIRRGIDAMAHRVERLRHCGNGVDPLVGAHAYAALDALQRQGRGTGSGQLAVTNGPAT